MNRILWAGLLAVSSLAWASDPPHDPSSSPSIGCDSCHTLHVGGAGAALTNVVGNYNLCKSCHDSRGPAFAWPSTYQAVPGKQGRSHRWDAPAANASLGTSTPTNPKLVEHLSGSNLQCSTCHDPHGNVAGNHGSQRASIAVGAALAPAGTGTGTMTLNAPASAATAKGYRVEIVAGGALGTATFRVSNDNGVSWFGWSGSAWAAGQAAGRPTGAGVALNDGANVTVTFAGAGFAVGDRWDFYIAYPMLQMSNVASELCENCHLARVQSAASIESGGDGVKVFSHPVGETLAKSYDRAGALLDANGAAQATGDGVATNDLKLDPTSKVRCQSCHSIHNADSNSLTEDLR